MNKKIISLAVTSALMALPATAAMNPKVEAPEWHVEQPQGEFNSVDISVNSGTWMNVDLSPDGETMLFDLLGDIYRMPASGGKAEKLTSDIAWQMQPVFSPDGSQIAFTSDQGGGDNIWVMDADGSNQRAVTEETFRLLNSPAWSPNGEFIVARKHYTATRSLGAGEVWMYHVSGGSGIQLTERPNEQKDLGEPAFSADGRYIYFSQDDTPGKTFHYSKDSLEGIYEIKRFERETGDIDTLIAGAGGAIRPTPSPDGRYLAYIKREDFNSVLYLLDLKTGEHKRIYKNMERDMQETWAIHGVYPKMDWTPDSQELVFWAGGHIQRLNIESGDARIVPFSVETTKQVQKPLRFEQNIDNDSFSVKMLRMTEVSPDGSEVVYEALGHLYRKTLPDGEVKRLTDAEHFELYPSYSRDGEKLVYVSWDDQRLGQVIVRDLSTGEEQVLNNEPGTFVEPTFAPDGESVVYRKVKGGYLTSDNYGLETGIFQVSINGGEPEKVADSGWLPQFGAANDRLYLMTPAAKPTLSVVDLETKQMRPLYQSELATEFRVSPDGKQLAFAERFKVFVTPLVERGEAIDIGPGDQQMPVRQLSVRAGESLSWTADSSQLYWTLGPELYHTTVTDAYQPGVDEQALQTESGLNISFEQPAMVPDSTVAFVGGQVITMEGDKVIEEGTVVVENNHITAVGAVDDIEVPAGAEVINVEGKTVMPGLFDAHAHGGQGSNEIIPQQNWGQYANLAFGVTSIHDPSNDTTEFFAASEMQKAGLIAAPRLYSTGTILYGAHGPGYTSHVDSLEDAKFHLQRLKKVGAFSVKSYNQPRRNQRQQVVQAGRELDMMVVPEGGSLLQHNLTMVVDGHTTVEHSLPVANIYDDIRQLWQQTDVAYTPTLGVAYGGIWGENYWYAETDVWKHPKLTSFVPQEFLVGKSMRREKAPHNHYNHFNNAEVATELQGLGVDVLSGAHGQREGLAQHWEIWMMAQGGMKPLDALRTATIAPAEVFGMDHQVGSLEEGKLADIIVIDGDPLANIRDTDKVTHTMINGVLYDAKTMDRLLPNAQQREPFFWEQ